MAVQTCYVTQGEDEGVGRTKGYYDKTTTRSKRLTYGNKQDNFWKILENFASKILLNKIIFEKMLGNCTNCAYPLKHRLMSYVHNTC